MTWGSHVSRLAEVLRKGHGKPEIDRQVKLSREDFDRIVTWIDLNAPYYPEYAGGMYRDNAYGRCPLDGNQVQKLASLTGVNVSRRYAASEVSRGRKSAPAWRGFRTRTILATRKRWRSCRPARTRWQSIPVPTCLASSSITRIEIEQQGKFDMLQQAEAQSRAAIVAGQKKYDRPRTSLPKKNI